MARTIIAKQVTRAIMSFVDTMFTAELTNAPKKSAFSTSIFITLLLAIARMDKSATYP
ncbi:MAG: hypothetical protein IKJ93_07040 [Clostridia bacterium]|nr:hypothetical protein [Clostridia bacterium]